MVLYPEQLPVNQSVCQQCGKTFDHSEKTRVYCSRSCAGFSKTKNRMMNTGYRTAYRGGGKMALEHRLVMEQHLGRELRPDEVVHHKDENKLNNDISNLEILSRREHRLKHSTYRDDHEKQCTKCGEVKPLDEFYRHPRDLSGRVSSCKICQRATVQKCRDKRKNKK